MVCERIPRDVPRWRVYAEPVSEEPRITALEQLPLHERKAVEAASTPQLPDWSRLYMSVTGLRCRWCYELFEDGEHDPRCPA